MFFKLLFFVVVDNNSRVGIEMFFCFVFMQMFECVALYYTV